MLINEVISVELDEGIHDPHIFKAVFVVGPPGSGKNTVMKHLGLNAAAGLKVGDVDDTLAFLRKTKRVASNDYALSLDVTKKRQSIWQRNYLGLLINTTGREPNVLKQLNDGLIDTGYSTFMLFVDVDEEIAAQRVIDREASATDDRDKRDVTQDYFKTAYKQSKASIEFYALMFGQDFALVTNNAKLARGVPVDASIQRAEKKIDRFLAAPLSPKAQKIVLPTKSQRG